jgi:hypothetical protein
VEKIISEQVDIADMALKFTAKNVPLRKIDLTECALLSVSLLFRL